jgi:hypothetical protein
MEAGLQRSFLSRTFVAGAFAVPPLLGQRKPDATVRERLLGAGRFVSVETTKANGEAVYPFYGKHPEGLIGNDRAGGMSVQIVSDPHPAVPPADSQEGLVAAPEKEVAALEEEKEKEEEEEKVAAVEGYHAYWGTWSVDASPATRTHHSKQSLFPGERGEDGVRHFVLYGDRLTWTAKTPAMGKDHPRRLIGKRAPADQS